MADLKAAGTIPKTTPTGPPSTLSITAPLEGSGVGKKFSVTVQIVPAVAGCEISGFVWLGSTRYYPTTSPPITTNASGSCSLSFQLPLTARGSFSLKVYTVNTVESDSYIGHFQIDGTLVIAELLEELIQLLKTQFEAERPKK